MKHILICLLFLLGLTIHAQQKNPLVIDLSEYDPGTKNTINENKNETYNCIVLKNAVVGYKYSIEIEKEVEISGPLSPYAALEVNDSVAKGNDSICNNLRKAIIEIEKAYDKKHRADYLKNKKKKLDEKELSLRIANLVTILKKKECKNDTLIQIAEIRIGQGSRYFYKDVSVETGEKITIKIKRDSLEWTYIIKGRQSGQWVTTYGFGFTSSALERDTYYSKQVPDTSTYNIFKSDKPENADLNYVPAIFFSYFPSQRFNKSWNHSLTAGLGFDLSAPVVYFGYNAMFWHNIGFSGGFAFQQQYGLKNKYSENEVISESLDKDQLHDKVYRPNLFISINFRFGENPFKNMQSNTDKE